MISSAAFASSRALFFYLCGWITITAQAADPVVSNVRAAQRPGTKLVEIVYDVADTDSPFLAVSVAVSDDGGATYAVPARSFSGTNSFGATVTPGTGKLIVWDAGKDWDGKFSSKMRFRVTADDGPSDLPGLVWIPAGTFTMGSPPTEQSRFTNEAPQTKVTVSQGFWMSKYETTQREYQAVIGNNPSNYKGDTNRPVEQVSWSDATNYCARLTARELAAGRLPAGFAYRLPTEAEWEYACRAGTTTPTAYGNGLGSTQANFDGNNPYGGAAKGAYLQTPVKVGSYAPNAWGLYDMHGNVLEWCLDWYSASLPGGSVTDPSGPITGTNRVNRGGSWSNPGADCRSARRTFNPPDVKSLSVNNNCLLAGIPATSDSQDATNKILDRIG